MSKPVHQITAWSGRVEDEAPHCGALAVEAFMHRTVFADGVTCEACLMLSAPFEDDDTDTPEWDDPNMGGRDRSDWEAAGAEAARDIMSGGRHGS